MQYIDTHSHIYEGKFDEDREEVYTRMREVGVTTIAVGTCLETSKKAVELARGEATRDVVVGATIGVHPTDTNEQFDISNYEQLLQGGDIEGKTSNVIVAIGECGFDYFRTPREDVYIRQREVFETQVHFAAKHDLPLMLHVRPSKGEIDAHEDALEVLDIYQKEYGDIVRGTIHFFTSTKEIAHEYVMRGFTVSFPGVITFAQELQEIVHDVPLDMIIAETDAPYASPVPHRGERNEPVFVRDTIKAIADIRGEDFEIITQQLYKNSQRVFLNKN